MTEPMAECGVVATAERLPSTWGERKRDARTDFPLWSATALLLAGFVLSSFVMRGHIQDDAFIELRYAKQLTVTGHFEYNSGQLSFGASSPAYVYLLAGLGSFMPFSAWPIMAKAVSTVGLVSAIGLSLWLVLTSPLIKASSAWVRAFTVLLLGSMLAVPSACRWLEDGMETSLGLASALACVVIVAQWHRRATQPGIGVVLLSGILLALPGIIRPDLVFISLAGVAGVGLLSSVSCRPRRLQAGLIAIGALSAWTLLIYLRQGAVLSDAALAKETCRITPLFFWSFLRAMAAVSPLWLLWPLLGVVLMIAKADRDIWRFRIAAILAVIPLASVLILGIMVGQFVQGARYFLADLGFMLGMLLAFSPPLTLVNRSRKQRVKRLALVAVVAMLTISLVHAAAFWRSDAQIGADGWGHIDRSYFSANELVGASDIGELSWFLPIRVFDLSGLVNGRKIAQEYRYGDNVCRTVGLMGFPEAFVVTNAQSSFLKENAGRIACPSGAATYANTKAVVMETHQTSIRNVYELWTRV
jgi:hypothetical protein